VAGERPMLVKGVVTVGPPAGAAFKVSTTTASSREPESLSPVLAWLNRTFPIEPVVTTPDPHPNRESTALKLADQGGFWIGIQHKQMPYGTIAQGQMFVQYMI